MSEKSKKYGLGIAILVAVLGLVAIVVSTSSTSEVESDELLGSPDESVTVDEIGPPPSLVIDPQVSLSGALTPDGNFYQFERSESLPSDRDLDKTAPREEWTALVFDDEYDSIDEFLNKNTTVTDQLTLVVVWDAVQQDWDVYPNEIFRSDYDIDTLDIFDDKFEGTVIFNTSRPYEYIDHTADREGDFDAERGWNYGPKPNFNSLRGRAVVVWEGDVTGNASRLTPARDLNDPIDRDFYDDLDDDEVYWFYVKGSVTDSCDDNEAFVCGVDGNTYQNSCKADAEDVDVDYEGKCKTDRTALIGRIEDETLAPDETLVLEFFESSSDNSPENLDIEDSEIDLDDNDTDLAIYKKDGARYEFVTAFSSSDVDVRSRAIEIDLNDKLAEGDYQLRIFDTFDKEKVREVELDFEVESAEVVEVTYSIVSITEDSVVLEPDEEVDAIDENEIDDLFALLDSAGNEVSGADVSMSSDKKVTISFNSDVFTADAVKRTVEVTELEDTQERWKIAEASYDLVALLAEITTVTDDNIYGGTANGEDPTIDVEFVADGSDLDEDPFGNDFDWLTLNVVRDGSSTEVEYDDYQMSDSVSGGKYKLEISTGSNGWDNGEYSLEIDFRDLSEDGYYLPSVNVGETVTFSSNN